MSNGLYCGKCHHPDGCPAPTLKHGRWCGIHRLRLHEHGDLGPVGRIKAPRGTGRHINEGGYVFGYFGDKPQLEHRFIVEQMLGRPLEPHESVHHINGIRDDNRPENLQLRSGHHGRGVVRHCADCGSENIVTTRIASPPPRVIKLPPLRRDPAA